MKLVDVVSGLDQLDESWTIYAKEPWSHDSQALVGEEPPEGGLPDVAESGELSYFVEVEIARNFILGWKRTLAGSPTNEETCHRLISYASSDA